MYMFIYGTNQIGKFFAYFLMLIILSGCTSENNDLTSIEDNPPIDSEVVNNNEVDDQFALAYAIKSSDKLNLEAVYAAPFHNNRSANFPLSIDPEFNLKSSPGLTVIIFNNSFFLIYL